MRESTEPLRFLVAAVVVDRFLELAGVMELLEVHECLDSAYAAAG